MGVPLSPYSSTDAVRAALALTDNELTDEMLTEQHLDAELELDLQTWVPTYSTIYTEGAAAGATEEQKLKSLNLTLYCQWYLAANAVNVMQLAVPQLIGDGKSEMRRFLNFDFEALHRSAERKAMHYKVALQGLLGTAPTTSGYSQMSVSLPDYDPVTNT